jgi:UPF0755 protein
MKRVRFLMLAVVVVVAAALPAAFFRYLVAVDRTFPRDTLTVIVPSGSTGHDVAALLENSGVIRSARTYDLLARLRGESSAMKAGEFRFGPHRTTAEVLAQVVSGGQQVAVWVTIPEGFTAKEIAQTLAQRDLGDESALEATFLGDSLVLDGSRSANLEGFLFPDTYLIPTAASPAQIAKIMTDQFAAELPPDAAAEAKKLGFTLPQIVTVASLVEREAKADDERPLMAGVYYNRLRLGIHVRAPQGRYHLRRPRARLALQHLRARGLAADADCQPGARVAPGRLPSPAVDVLILRLHGEWTSRVFANAGRTQRERRSLSALETAGTREAYNRRSQRRSHRRGKGRTARHPRDRDDGRPKVRVRDRRPRRGR